MRSRAARTLVLLGLVLAACAAPAGAATKNGIRPIAPAESTTVDAGRSPTFRMRVRGPGKVWVHVCASSRRNAKGVICHRESIGQARERRGVHRYRPRFFDYPGFWLNQPGRYYWQAHRIHCGDDSDDCLREGPVVRFRVA